jgi:hypothetical protein
MVRILFPPAVSQQRTVPAVGFDGGANRNRGQGTQGPLEWLGRRRSVAEDQRIIGVDRDPHSGVDARVLIKSA